MWEILEQNNYRPISLEFPLSNPEANDRSKIGTAIRCCCDRSNETSRFHFRFLSFIGRQKDDCGRDGRDSNSVRHRPSLGQSANFSWTRMDQRLLATSSRFRSAPLAHPRVSTDRGDFAYLFHDSA